MFPSQDYAETALEASGCRLVCGSARMGKVKHPDSRKNRCGFTSCKLCRRIGYYTERKLRNRKALTCDCYKPTHNSWRKMIERCTYKNHRSVRRLRRTRHYRLSETGAESFSAFVE